MTYTLVHARRSDRIRPARALTVKGMVAVTVTSPAVRSGSVMSGPDVMPGPDPMPGADGERARFDRPEFDVAAAYDAQGRVLLGFAINAVRDRGLGEDCVQEVFLRAWKARARFDPARASERTWLFAIARNVIADALAARGRRSAAARTPSTISPRLMMIPSNDSA